jgi:photosystem II stability/assembly factor-like uncharacterized protein
VFAEVQAGILPLAQDISDDGKICGFVPIDIEPHPTYRLDQEIERRVGDLPLLVFETEEGCFEIGERAHLVGRVEHFLKNSGNLADRPFLRAALAEFCGDAAATGLANRDAIEQLARAPRSQAYFRINVLVRDRIKLAFAELGETNPPRFRLDGSDYELNMEFPYDISRAQLVTANKALRLCEQDLCQIIGKDRIVWHCNIARRPAVPPPRRLPAKPPAYVYAGTAWPVGAALGGIFRQQIGDNRWTHLTNGFPEGADVHAITIHPEKPNVIYIGTARGIYRSNNSGNRWERLNLPEDTDIWSICIHPKNPRIVYAGAGSPAIYRSADGGDSWRNTANPGLPDRAIMGFACRVIRLDVDPSSPNDVYATLEANGAMRSRNGGESWEDCTAGLRRFCEQPKYGSRIGSQTEIEAMLDGHALAVSEAAPGSVFLANGMGLFRSDDRGEHWQDIEIGRFSPLTYGRDIRVSPHDPRVLYACLSPAAQNTDGSIFRSDDLGRTWKRFDHSVRAEAAMVAVAVHPRDANQVYGVSYSGQVFATQDGGGMWRETRLPDGVCNVFAIACG